MNNGKSEITLRNHRNNNIRIYISLKLIIYVEVQIIIIINPNQGVAILIVTTFKYGILMHYRKYIHQHTYITQLNKF